MVEAFAFSEEEQRLLETLVRRISFDLDTAEDKPLVKAVALCSVLKTQLLTTAMLKDVVNKDDEAIRERLDLMVDALIKEKSAEEAERG